MGFGGLGLVFFSQLKSFEEGAGLLGRIEGVGGIGGGGGLEYLGFRIEVAGVVIP